MAEGGPVHVVVGAVRPAVVVVVEGPCPPAVGVADEGVNGEGPGAAGRHGRGSNEAAWLACGSVHRPLKEIHPVLEIGKVPDLLGLVGAIVHAVPALS